MKSSFCTSTPLMKNPSGRLFEKCFVDINGARQGMFIVSDDISNPVLLFVHGGPGMPEFFLEEKYPTGLEKHFTVCYWEQRGAGLSYYAGLAAERVTVDQLIDDTIAVARYLCGRFGQEKSYLLAHSWGTYIGIQAAQRSPGSFHAYIGVGQIANMFESERIAHDYMVKEYEKRGDTGMVQKLLKFPVARSDEAVTAFFTSLLRDQAMHKIGIGTMRGMSSVVTGVLWATLRCKAYTLRERVNIWRAKAFLRKKTELVERFFHADLMSRDICLDIPAYFMSGLYDYTVNKEVSQRFVQKLTAPQKAFYIFENSAHSPMFEEPERFVSIMRENVLASVHSTVRPVDRRRGNL